MTEYERDHGSLRGNYDTWSGELLASPLSGEHSTTALDIFGYLQTIPPAEWGSVDGDILEKIINEKILSPEEYATAIREGANDIVERANYYGVAVPDDAMKVIQVPLSDLRVAQERAQKTDFELAVWVGEQRIAVLQQVQDRNAT